MTDALWQALFTEALIADKLWTKRCSSGHHVPLSGFARCSKALDGLQGMCRACHKAYMVKHKAKAQARLPALIVMESEADALERQWLALCSS